MSSQTHPRLLFVVYITQRLRRTKKARRGFTLIEILVVLAIMGLLMSLVGPRVFNALSDSKVKTAKVQIADLTAAVDLFFLDAARYPTPAEGLNALFQKPEDAPVWNGPYVKGSGVPKDPWGHPYIYRLPPQGGSYEILSLGPDGREDGRTIIEAADTAKP